MKPGRVETGVGLLILLILLGIAGAVVIKQSRYDESAFVVALPDNASSFGTLAPTAVASNLQDYLPGGMEILTPVETFGPENLSEKIDGKAELYLSAGFVSLRCQRFVETGKLDRWLEVFVYDMGSMRNAFSVYSTQRRADAEDLAFTQFAYRTANALFFLQGQVYVEVIATSEQMAEAMLDIGQNFIRKNPTNSEAISEVAIFPKASMIPDSVSLLSENVFGFSDLNNTFVARYRLGETELTAFLSRRETAQEAQDLAQAYLQFLVANGGVEAAMEAAIPEARLVKIFDAFELVLVHGSFLAGVHEADNKDLAEQLALQLKNAVAEAAK